MGAATAMEAEYNPEFAKQVKQVCTDGKAAVAADTRVNKHDKTQWTRKTLMSFKNLPNNAAAAIAAPQQQQIQEPKNILKHGGPDKKSYFDSGI